ncbi:MAG: zinc ribbon domain-containing protein [Lachnospiraceae bacterium]|nr:zinc ribbon domain-containing protein [Lachnospiraceae bacterium]
MAIAVNVVKCPNCGANLHFEEGREKIFCSYCGTPIIVTNENEKIYRYIDEAGIKQVETNRMVRMRELEIEEKREGRGDSFKKILMTIWLILSLIVIVICIIKIAIEDDFTTGFLMLFYIGGPVIGGGGYLIFKLIPEKESEKLLMRNGGIRLPKDILNYYDKNYEVILVSLQKAGFCNITCSNMHDLTLGLFQKPGRVDSITVNGERLTSAGKIYMPDVPIIISYHGK